MKTKTIAILLAVMFLLTVTIGAATASKSVSSPISTKSIEMKKVVAIKTPAKVITGDFSKRNEINIVILKTATVSVID